MTKVSTGSQILSDAEAGLLPYLRNQLQSPEFAKFEAQFSFQVESSKTYLQQEDSCSSLQTTLSLSLKFLIILHSKFTPDDAALLALELQEMLDAHLVQWSQNNPHLLSPIAEIQGSFGSLEEVRYQGGYLPGFSLHIKFELLYKATLDSAKDSSLLQEQHSKTIT